MPSVGLKDTTRAEVTEMSIIERTKSDFDKYKPARGPLTGTLILEKAWFASQSETILGVVTFDVTDKDWGFAILGRDENGQFRGIDSQISLATMETARDALLAAMVEIVVTGQSMFPQGDTV